MDPTRSPHAPVGVGSALSGWYDPAIPRIAGIDRIAILATADDGLEERLAMAIATVRDFGGRAVIVDGLDAFFEQVVRLGPHALVVSGVSSLADADWGLDEALRHLEEAGCFAFRVASGRLLPIVRADVWNGPLVGVALRTEAWS